MNLYNALTIYFDTLKTQGYYPYKQSLNLLSFLILHKTIEHFEGCISSEDRVKFEELLECWSLHICGLVSMDQC